MVRSLSSSFGGVGRPMSDSLRFQRGDVQKNLMGVMAAMDREHWIEDGSLCYYPGTKEAHCRSGFPARALKVV